MVGSSVTPMASRYVGGPRQRCSRAMPHVHQIDLIQKQRVQDIGYRSGKCAAAATCGARPRAAQPRSGRQQAHWADRRDSHLVPAGINVDWVSKLRLDSRRKHRSHAPLPRGRTY